MDLVLSAGKSAVEAYKSGEASRIAWAAAKITGGGVALLGASKENPKAVTATRKDGKTKVSFTVISSGSVQFDRLPEDVRDALLEGKSVLMKDAKAEAATAMGDGSTIELV